MISHEIYRKDRFQRGTSVILVVCQRGKIHAILLRSVLQEDLKDSFWLRNEWMVASSGQPTGWWWWCT